MSERSLFLSALEIEDAAAREAFLAEACAGNPQLRTEVEALLKSHGEAGAFLEIPAAEAVMPTIVEDGSSAQDQPDDDLGFLSPSATPGSLGQLGHYEVKEVLGRGAFGIVLRAFDEKLHRMVAIKVMNPELAATSPPRKRFLREARSSASVRHENIVAIHNVEEQPIPYLVMEYIPGMTLQQRLDSHGPLDAAEVLRIGQQIANGLSAAHAKGLIHRDIKPANILLETGLEERAKITDFGLARAADDASLTQSGLIAGTPMYMAPEQAKGQPLDHRADLFSLGSVLYVMASGRPPFRAPNTIAVLKRVCEDTPRPIDEVIPGTPPWLCDIIGKLLAKEPDDRFQSAKEVADVLGQHLAHWQQPQTAPRPAPIALLEPARTLMLPVAAPRQPTVGLMWLMGTGLLLAVALMFVAVWRGLDKMQGQPLVGTVQTGVVFLTLTFLWVTAFAVWGFVRVLAHMRRNPSRVSRPSPTAAASNAGVPADRPRGTLSQAWHDWWSELDRWITVSVQVVLLVVYLVCMLLFVSMGATGGHDEEGNATFAYRLGAPDPWFQFDVHPEPLVPFRTGVTLTASSVLIGLLGCLVYGIFWRIEKVRNPRTSKWNGPTFMLGIWGVGAVGAVALGHWQGYAALAKPRMVVAAGGDKSPASAPMSSAIVDAEPSSSSASATEGAGNLIEPTPTADPDRRAAEWVLAIGGEVHIATNNRPATPVRTAKELPTEPFHIAILYWNDNPSVDDAALQRLKDLQHLWQIGLHRTRITDAGLKTLGDIASLEVVQISGTGVTDAGIQHLGRLPRLRSLNCGSTKVTAAGLIALRQKADPRFLYLSSLNLSDSGLKQIVTAFGKLERLDVAFNPITDVGLESLMGMTSLRELGLLDTTVTKAGVQKLSAALPGCKIEWDGGVIEPTPSSDPDRRAAEWVLSIGGGIHIKVNG